jgi:hypothetical protein
MSHVEDTYVCIFVLSNVTLFFLDNVSVTHLLVCIIDIQFFFQILSYGFFRLATLTLLQL